MAADEQKAPASAVQAGLRRAEAASAAQAGRALTPAARRALAEAEARRRAAAGEKAPAPKETGGPRGEEPTRYGDWERSGRAVDF